MSINGTPVTVPEYTVTAFEDYDKMKVSFVKIHSSDIILPENTKITDRSDTGTSEIFVKAGTFYNDNGKEDLKAKDIREIMFDRDT
jgi:hypothetical protein